MGRIFLVWIACHSAPGVELFCMFWFMLYTLHYISFPCAIWLVIYFWTFSYGEFCRAVLIYVAVGSTAGAFVTLLFITVILSSFFKTVNLSWIKCGSFAGSENSWNTWTVSTIVSSPHSKLGARNIFKEESEILAHVILGGCFRTENVLPCFFIYRWFVKYLFV